MPFPTKIESATLEYFPIRGRAEPIRLMLEDHGVSYSDLFVTDGVKWEADKTDYNNYPFNQIPIFHVNGKKIAQQDAILRYITKVTGKKELSLEDETISDMLAISVEDLNRMYTGANYSDDHVTQYTTLLNTTVPKVFAQYEHLLGRLSGANPPTFIEGPNPAFAEYTLFHLVEAIMTLQPSALGKSPRLLAWFEAFSQRKGIRAFVDSERRLELINFNTNGQKKILE